MVAYTAAVKAELQSEAASLDDLDPPEDETASAALDEYIGAQIDLVAQVEAAAQNSNVESVEALYRQAAQELGAVGPDLQAKYGFTACGSEGEVDQRQSSPTTEAG
jgi:hypothetical protein